MALEMSAISSVRSQSETIRFDGVTDMIGDVKEPLDIKFLLDRITELEGKLIIPRPPSIKAVLKAIQFCNAHDLDFYTETHSLLGHFFRLNLERNAKSDITKIWLFHDCANKECCTYVTVTTNIVYDKQIIFSQGREALRSTRCKGALVGNVDMRTLTEIHKCLKDSVQNITVELKLQFS